MAFSPGPEVRRQILAADDDPGILRLIQVSLEREGFCVWTAADGSEASSFAIPVPSAL